MKQSFLVDRKPFGHEFSALLQLLGNFDISELENILFGQPVSTRLNRACHNPKTDNDNKNIRKIIKNFKQNSNLSTELRLDHEPQESCSRKPQKKIRIAAAATRGLGLPLKKHKR